MPKSCYHTLHQQHHTISSPIQPTPCISSLELIIPERPWQQISSLPQQQAEGEKLLIGSALAEELRQSLPTRFKLLSTWTLTYSTLAFGFSLSTLYSRCKATGPAILAVKDDSGQLFGAFCSESISPQLNHFGSGEWCRLPFINFIVFYGKRIVTTQRIYIEPQEEAHSTLSLSLIFLQSVAGMGHQFMVSVCREGKFGLLLDGDLFSGQSNQVSTFDNDILSCSQKFDITSVEVWTFK